VSENISLFCPLVIPFHGSRFARWVNRKVLLWSLRRICRKLGFARPITLTFVPSSADVAGSLGERILIYYCVDEYSEFTGTDRAAMLDMERRLMEKSDLVIVSASRLHETKQRYNSNTLLITHGVDVTHFRKACLAETPIPIECSGLPHPVIGFFGLIADWVDLEVIRSLACARPEWSFVLIGESRTDTSDLKQLPNIHLLGRRSYEDLPGYCKAFDAAILPFLVNELTIAANPLKLREYLAAGLPVVATPLPEIQKLGHLVHLAGSPAEYLAQLETLFKAGNHGPRLDRSLSMDTESWDGKVEQLSTLIQGLKTPATARQLA
jgi:glycosyltransferase involved in cell wall biosynthesis